MDYSQPQRADALAAAYVAGTMRGAAKRRFEQLLPSSTARPTTAASAPPAQAPI
jgi:anti-sigma-K factor RskA